MKRVFKILLVIIGIIILSGLIFYMADYFRIINNKEPIFCILEDEVNDGGTKIYLGLGYKIIDFHKIKDEDEYYDDVKIGFWNINYEDFKSEYENVNDSNIGKNNLASNPQYTSVSLEKLPKDYTAEQAISDGCLIISNNNKIYNKSMLEDFLHNTSSYYTKQKEPSKIRIVQFTIEGQIIIQDVEYREDGKFVITTDYTRDEFTSEEDRKINSNEYSAEEYYILKSMGENLVEINLVTNEGKAEDAILICAYPREAEVEELPSFYSKISDINETSIIVEPLEGEKERSNTSDRYSLGVNIKEDYKVGEIVKVTYTGLVRESYPAKIDLVKLEKIDLKDFELVFENSNEGKSIILDSSKDDSTDYNVYSFKGDVFVIIDEKIMNLKDALLDNKITMEKIINKAVEDEKNGNITKESYLDGGSVRYSYKDYVIIKCNTLDGNKDVYFGNTDFII